jgi:dihydrofolate reductase
MRQVVLSAFMSIDGYSADPGTEAMNVFMAMEDDAEQEEYGIARLRSVGTHIMGRGLYVALRDYWPTSPLANAAPMNEIPKVVFSRTLTEQDATWAPTTIALGDTAEEIAKLKAQPGGPILCHGTGPFARSLIELGLIDEFRICVVPVAEGKGAALFTDVVKLRLVSSKAFASGLVELAYSPV